MPIQSVINLFPPNEEKSSGLSDTLVLMKSSLEEKNREIKFSMDLLLDASKQVSSAIDDLKKENSEIKNKINNIEQNGGGNTLSSFGSVEEQVREKDKIIINLRKEIQDLKIQRSHQAKQMGEIQYQVSILKKNAVKDRAPLRNGRNDENKQSKTLSLKFDDIADQYIVNDL